MIHLPHGNTYYELAGPPDGAVVVLIHGFSVPSYIWEPTFQPLAQADLRPLRLDLYGRGNSARPKVDYTLELFVEQIADLLDALEIHTPVHLVGLSMGGPIAAGFCAAHPERAARLVLIDPAGMIPWTSIRLSALRTPGLGEGIFGLFGKKFIVRSQESDFHHPERFRGYGELARPQMLSPGYFRALLSTLRKGPLGDLSELYRQVGEQGREILIVWGQEDRTFPVALGQKALAWMPAARLEVIADAGHIPHYEHPEIVNPLLKCFLFE
jgi:pimeloyl-ACP methyl ester carboxylesterase